MRTVIPTLVWPVSGVDFVPLFGDGSVYVYAPVAYELGHASPGYFWDTKKRAQNDCLHKKVAIDSQRTQYSVADVLSASGTLTNGRKFVTEGIYRDERFKHRAYNYECVLEKVAGKEAVVQYEWLMDCRSFRQRSLPGQPVQYQMDRGSHTFTFRMRHYRFAPDPSNPNWDRTYSMDQILASFHVRWMPGKEEYISIENEGVLADMAGQKVAMDTGFTDAWFDNSDQLLYSAYRAVYQRITPFLRLAQARRKDKPYGQWGRGSSVRVAGVDPFQIDKVDFLLEEPTVVRDHLYPSDRLAGYWRSWLEEHAYYDALDSAPVMSDNNIQNLGELVGFIRNLVVEHKISMPRSLQDAWLAYRYSYQTTKSDVEEAIEFVNREMDLSALESAYLHCHGIAKTTYKGVEVTCRCSLKLEHREVGYLRELWFQLYKYGLQPNFYVLWDSLPYSFMVDWFIPMGDVASVMDASANYCGDTFDIKDVVFSLQYRQTDGHGRVINFYSRWASRPLVSLNAMYWFDKPRSADKTWVCRFLDAASLFIR